MASSHAVTVDDYLSELPAERRAVVSAVREVVNRHLPNGYAETPTSGMIGWGVPLARFPNTYNGQPLCYVALAAQKKHYALYLMSAYGDPGEAAWLADAFRRAGKKLDMGKSCLRFKGLDDLPLDAIGEFVSRTTPETLIAHHERARTGTRGGAA